ncbi:hypothetical protein Acr_12g0000670 [Actinidia rufa]|uniref:Uncharacterized protein n=1 Tax=Actinidia rufa TaxID=165716 RepID=A0A7J0FGH1_9ERIC|nr:hypothetical protein Acr_12g0000670 [Actinidia rufa]
MLTWLLTWQAGRVGRATGSKRRLHLLGAWLRVDLTRQDLGGACGRVRWRMATVFDDSDLPRCYQKSFFEKLLTGPETRPKSVRPNRSAIRPNRAAGVRLGLCGTQAKYSRVSIVSLGDTLGSIRL